MGNWETLVKLVGMNKLKMNVWTLHRWRGLIRAHLVTK